jgi:putative membrane protein
MLRYMLLAGAAAVAIPGASLAQIQWSQPLPGENDASSTMVEGGPLDSLGDHSIPYNQEENTGIAAGTYGTGQLEQSRSTEVYVFDATDDTAAAQGPQPGDGVSGGQPSGGYYFGDQGDQPLVSGDLSPASQQGSYSAPPEGAYSGQPYQGYGGGGYYTGQPGGPNAFVGQGPGSSESTTAGQGLGGEGTYQQGQSTYGAYSNAPADQGYGGGYYASPQGSPYPPSQQPYAAPPPGASQGSQYPPSQQPYAAPPPGAYSNAPPSQGYGGGGYYTGPQGSQYPPSQQPYAAPPPGASQGAYSNAPPSQGYGGGYYTSPQGSQSQQPYAAPPPGASQGAYSNAPPNQGYGGGYYTGQQGAYGGQGAYDQTGATESAGQQLAENATQQLVIVPARIASARRYVRASAIANVYQIEAARIALRRSQSSDVRDFANQMIQEHQQGLALITQAAAQAGVPQRPMLDRAHRAMLRRLARASDSDFDRVYMNQQLVAHMNLAALQAGYLQNGRNPVLVQAAAQLNPIVQQHVNQTFAMSELPQRLAQQRDTELALLDQNAGRGQVYRGYTVIGPTAGEEGAAGAYQGGAYQGGQGGAYQGGAYQGGAYQGGAYQGGAYQGGAYQGGQSQGGAYQGGADQGAYYPGAYNGAAPNKPYLAPAAYQQGQLGAGSSATGTNPGSAQGAPGAGTTGYGAGAPGTPGYQTPGAGVTPGTSGSGAGLPGTSGYGTTPPGASGTYQGYTSPGLGTTTPGTSPGAPPGAPGSPYTTTPSSPGYMTPPPPPPGATGPGGP